MQPEHKAQRLVPFALSDLPLIGQQTLAKSPYRIVREALAIAPNTHLDVVDNLGQHESGYERNAMLRRTRNVGMLTGILRTAIAAGGREAGEHSDICSASRNPNAPGGLLTQMLRNVNKRAALEAYINPATPKKAKQQLTIGRAGALIETGETSEGQTIRANELVLANPWMLQNPTGWCGDIRRAFTNSPAATKSTLAAVRKTSHINIEKHPANRGIDIATLDVTALLQLECGAGDVLALAKPEFTETDAIYISNRDSLTETHIVGRIINRYGVVVALTHNKKNIDRASNWNREIATQWLAPLLAWGSPIGGVEQLTEEEYHDTQIAITLLGDNQQNWEAFTTLLPDWYGTSIEAATAVCNV